MITLDLDALERAAQAATPGPWIRVAGYRVECHELLDVKDHGHYSTFSGGTKAVVVADTVKGHRPERDAEYIAAANPAAVLELVRRLRAAEAVLTTKIEQLSGGTVLVKTDKPGDIYPALRQMLERGIIKQAVLVGAGTELTTLDETEMRKAGWLREERQRAALHAAVAAIYFDDSSDFKSSLFEVVKELAPHLADVLENDPSAAWHMTMPAAVPAQGGNHG